MTREPEHKREAQDDREERIELIFRKSTPLSDSKCRYPGFEPGSRILPKGSVHRKGALPLPCDILFERDVAVPMRDGVTIYIDIFRPPDSEKIPAIVSWIQRRCMA